MWCVAVCVKGHTVVCVSCVVREGELLLHATTCYYMQYYDVHYWVIYYMYYSLTPPPPTLFTRHTYNNHNYHFSQTEYSVVWSVP